jgi:hypothetical protein
MDKATVTKKALAAVVRRTVNHAAPDRTPYETDELRSDPETPTFEPPSDDSPARTASTRRARTVGRTAATRTTG